MDNGRSSTRGSTASTGRAPATNTAYDTARDRAFRMNVECALMSQPPRDLSHPVPRRIPVEDFTGFESSAVIPVGTDGAQVIARELRADVDARQDFTSEQNRPGNVVLLGDIVVLILGEHRLRTLRIRRDRRILLTQAARAIRPRRIEVFHLESELIEQPSRRQVNTCHHRCPLETVFIKYRLIVPAEQGGF